MEGNTRPQSFHQFWDLYLQEHQNRANRWLHLIGTLSSLLLLAYVIATENYLLILLVPVLGYGPAWFGHWILEKNRPLTLQAPVWSLCCDYRLTCLLLMGCDPQSRRSVD